MFRHRWGIGVFCILATFIWVVPAAAQFDRCSSREKKIEYGHEILGSIPVGSISSDDNDFCFEGKKGDRVVVVATRTWGDGNIGVTLTNFNILGMIVSDLPLLEDTASVSYRLPEDGAYHISVSGGVMASVGYRLTVTNQNAASAATPTPRPIATRTPASTDSSEATTWENACFSSFILIPGYSLELGIQDEQPLTLYCFYGMWGNRYNITANQTSGDLDPVIYVFMARTKEQVAFNDDQSLLNKNARVDFVVEETGVYIVVVTRVDFEDGDTEGDYEVEIENLTHDAPETCPAAFSIPPEGVTIPEDDSGFYAFCFNGKNDQIASLTVEAQRGNLNLEVYITHTDLTEVTNATSTDSTLELSTRIKRDEPYMILVFDNSRQGGFDLKFEQD